MTVAFLAAAALQAAAADVWSRRWPLAENLAEAAGECPLFAKGPVPPAFVTTDGVRGVSLVERKLTANDHPSCGLAPGFRFSCKVRFERLSYGGGEGAVILSKGLSTDVPGAFLLRVDPSSEGSFFSFFANTDGCIEPRVQSRQPARRGVWYDLSGGWDGETISLTVNGDTTCQRRTGRRSAGDGPFAVGPLVGQVADVRLSGPADPVARNLPLSPGFGVACSVTFSSEPTGETVILKKDGEYQLRYDRPTPDATGEFHFFVCLDGSWEPRCWVRKAVETDRRYDVTAGWDGLKAFLQVDGEEHVQARRGKVRPQGRPLRVGGPGVEVGGVAARSLNRALPVVRELRTRELMPADGEPFTLLAELANLGSPLPSGVVRATATKGVQVTPAEIPFGSLADARPVPLEWRVDPGKATDFDVHVTVFAGGRRVGATSSRFATMPKSRPDLSSSAWQPPVRETSAHYVDARAGDDGRDGRTPETAWRTFAHVNGRTLGPGERLLLRRGSVFTEELVVTAQGATDNWAEIAAYGEGARPIIRRNRDIDDRCAHIVDPGCLVVRDLVFCNAGKGLDIVGQDAGRAHGVLVERCLAHHIEGLYYNAHGIPEWRDRFGAPGPGARGGLNLTGLGLRNAILRDCETYQCSFGFQVGGRNTFLSRIYCHDNVCHNTSPHPFLTNTTRAWLVDSVFERSGWHASAGTMGIMLGGNVGLEIHGCHFLRQPDSDCPDEGGIDFECSGHNYLVDGCTFRGCAGAAIEILGLRSPQSRNVHIRGNRFDRNNFAKKLGPSEIFVWGGSKDRGIVCSSGLVEGNGFVLNPGVTFYTNQAVSTRADWKVRDNREFRSAAELDRAMPYNDPPAANAGPELWITADRTTLAGTVSDDGRPSGRTIVRWEQLEGPGTAEIATADEQRTEVRFPETGDYRFNLSADDGRLWRTSRTAVHVLPSGARTLKTWTFARDHDAEGWSTEKLGTSLEKVACGLTFNSWPVDIVGGDYYTFVAKDAREAALLSADGLGIGLPDGTVTLMFRLQNHTPSQAMRLWWMKDGDDGWDAGRSTVFRVTPNDADDTVYRVNLPGTGRLRRLKVGLSADGAPVTGTCRLDYIWLGMFSVLSAGQDETREIQRRIDEVSVRGGGRVTVSRGDHPIGSLVLKDGVDLHLEAGARLVGSRNPEDYVLDLSGRGYGERITKRWSNAMIRIVGAKDVSVTGEADSEICGRNCYDGKGEEGFRGPHAISAYNVTNLVLRGYTVRDAGNFGLYAEGCVNVRAHQVEVHGGHDAFDFFYCRDIRVERCRIFSGDDCVAGYGNAGLTVRDCELNSACSYFRLGGDDVLIENCRGSAPAENPHRWTLSADEKKLEVAPTGSGRRTTLSVFTFFTGRKVKSPARNIVFRNCRFAGAERLLHYNLSGSERWQQGQGLADVTFDRVSAENLQEPLVAYGVGETPLCLRMRESSLSFRSKAEAVVRGAHVGELDFEHVTVKGVDGPLMLRWGEREPIVRKAGLKGVSDEIRPAQVPFKARSI